MIASNTDHMGGQAVRLDSIAKVIRSKTAGPCLLTLDVMLPDAEAFGYVAARAGALRRQIARRYGRSENEVAVLPFEPALAVKITLPRDVVSGDVGDRDVYGAQQHAPLLDIELCPPSPACSTTLPAGAGRCARSAPRASSAMASRRRRSRRGLGAGPARSAATWGRSTSARPISAAARWRRRGSARNATCARCCAPRAGSTFRRSSARPAPRGGRPPRAGR